MDSKCECCGSYYEGDGDSCRCESCCVSCMKPKGSSEWVKGHGCPARNFSEVSRITSLLGEERKAHDVTSLCLMETQAAMHRLKFQLEDRDRQINLLRETMMLQHLTEPMLMCMSCGEKIVPYRDEMTPDRCRVILYNNDKR